MTYIVSSGALNSTHSLTQKMPFSYFEKLGEKTTVLILRKFHI